MKTAFSGPAPGLDRVPADRDLAGVAFTIGLGVITFGTLAGSVLLFILRRAGMDPGSASAPFAATLVDVTGHDY